MGISSCAGSDLQYTIAGTYVFFYIAHSGKELHRAMLGHQPLVLVIMIIEFDQIWICVRFCLLVLKLFLSLLIADYLRFCLITFIGADQKIFIISHNSVVPVPSGDFYLISQINIMIFQ